jgi:hypothetical protein
MEAKANLIYRVKIYLITTFFLIFFFVVAIVASDFENNNIVFLSFIPLLGFLINGYLIPLKITWMEDNIKLDCIFLTKNIPIKSIKKVYFQNVFSLKNKIDTASPSFIIIKGENHFFGWNYINHSFDNYDKLIDFLKLKKLI